MRRVRACSNQVAYDWAMTEGNAETTARFQAAQDAMPVHARVARAAAMFVWARDLIAREIVSRAGPLPSERLKWETALRLYGSDDSARRLIQQMLDRVSG